MPLKATNSSPNPELFAFWQEHGAPGRIGLIHLDFAPARLINWGQKRVTRDGKPSLWVHTFLITEPRDGVPWIVESDVRIPLPGFDQTKPDGPQANPVTKWSYRWVDWAAVLDPGLTHPAYQTACAKAEELLRSGYRYPLMGLGNTWLAYLRNDLSYRGPLAPRHSMHCSHFLRECLSAAGMDPFGSRALSKNIAPEHFFQTYPAVAAWVRKDVPVAVRRRIIHNSLATQPTLPSVE